MTKIKQLIAIALAAILGFGSMPAFAWDGTVTGTVAYIDVDNSSVVWVTLTGGPALCSGGSQQAYLVAADAYQKLMVSALLVAKAVGNSVTLYTTNNGTNCHIGYVKT